MPKTQPIALKGGKYAIAAIKGWTKMADYQGLQRGGTAVAHNRVKARHREESGTKPRNSDAAMCERVANKGDDAPDVTAIYPRPSNTDIIRELTRAKAVFQLRTICAVMGVE